MTVDFIIAGVQKAGTTALHHYLNKHANIYMPAKKELHFFNNESAVDWRQPDYSIYHKEFAQQDSTILVGEATPIYSFWPNALKRIKAYNSSIKLILLLRNPADRAFSHWKMEFSRQNERLPFSEAIRAGRARLAPPFCPSNALSRFSYVERGFYCNQIETILSLFPESQVLFLNFPDLIESPRLLLDEVCRFLNVPQYSGYPEQTYVPSYSPPAPTECLGNLAGRDREYLDNLFEMSVMRTETLTGLDISNRAPGMVALRV